MEVFLWLPRYSYRSSSIPMAPGGICAPTKLPKHPYGSTGLPTDRSPRIPMAPGGNSGLKVLEVFWLQVVFPASKLRRYSCRCPCIPIDPKYSHGTRKYSPSSNQRATGSTRLINTTDKKYHSRRGIFYCVAFPSYS